MLNLSNLHRYQLTGKEHILKNPYCGLFLEMGLGKTVTTLTAINTLMFEEFEVAKVLVIAPKRVAEHVWSAEVKNWEHLKHLKVSRVMGTPAQRLAALKAKADIYTIGRDNIAWLVAQYGGSMLPFDMVVIDESSSFKNPKSVRFKALRKVRPTLARMVLLTGTPSPNGLMDLWSQIYLLDMGKRLGKFITSYRENFFKAKTHQFAKYKIRDSADKEIFERIEDICLSMKAEDYLTLAGRKNNYVKIYFDRALRKKYEDFERELVLELLDSGEEISVMTAAALTNKLLQFSNGAVYDEYKKVHEIHRLKLDALDEIIEQSEGKNILIAWTFRHDLHRLKKHLAKYKPVHLRNNKEIDNWNEGKTKILLMHPASGGHGLNLQKGGSVIVWFGQTWSLELYQQLNARLDRQGQTDLTVIHHLVANGTVEEDVISSLDKKDRTQNTLMTAIKAKIKKYSNTFR